jgi:pantetheine-phosphate adenylyltransferase
MSQLDPRTCIYPGSFDPLTNGHIDIIQRCLAIYDRVVVAVADNVRKTPLFTLAERMAIVREAVPDGRVEVDSFRGLLVEYVQGKEAKVVVRGLRALTDFEYEFQLAHMNRRLAPGVETVFLMTGDRDFFVSSSLVKEVATLGGDVSNLVPEAVRKALVVKFANR